MLISSLAPTVVASAPGVIVAEVSKVCVAIWRGPVTPPRFDVQRDGLGEVIGRHREGIGLLCVIEPTAKPPDDELRRASADMVREHQSSLHCIACVVEGAGFANALGRSVLSAMMMLIGQRNVPMSVFGTVGCRNDVDAAPHERQGLAGPGGLRRVGAWRDGAMGAWGAVRVHSCTFGANPCLQCTPCGEWSAPRHARLQTPASAAVVFTRHGSCFRFRPCSRASRSLSPPSSWQPTPGHRLP